MTVTLVGGVPFEAADESYVLRYSVNALIVLEEQFDTDVQGVMAKVEEGGMRTLRSVFRAGLLDCKPGITEAEAGEVMTAAGIEEAGKLIEKALLKAFPSAAKVAGEGGRPQKAAAKRAAGNGTASTVAGAA